MRVRGEVVGEVGAGVCVLLGVARADTDAVAERLAWKVARLRIFADDAGRFDRSLLDVGGGALVVSQFTLIADYNREKATARPLAPGWSGNRPSFTQAAPREQAESLYERFCDALRDLGVPVTTGVFGASMQLELVNDGPVTILLDV